MYCSLGDMGAGSVASAAMIVGTWGDVGRCGEMWGDAGRYGKMQGRVRVGGGGAHELLGRYGEIS